MGVQIKNPPVFVQPTAVFFFSGNFPDIWRKNSNDVKDQIVEKSFLRKKNRHDDHNSNNNENKDEDFTNGHSSSWEQGGDAHNIAINEQSGYAYLVGSDKCNGGLYMLDIRSPLNPVFAGCFIETGYIHDVQCITYDGPDVSYTEREICFASNGQNGLSIIDVTNKGGPFLISRLDKNYFVFIHQGWLSEERNFFIMGDEGDQGFTKTYIVDVANLDNPNINGIHTSSIEAQSHNMFVRGQYVYQANYRGGLRILDLLEIYGEESEAGYFDVYRDDDQYGHQGAFGVYPFFESGNVIISSVNDGLFIVQPEWLTPAPTNPPFNRPPLISPTPNCLFNKVVKSAGNIMLKATLRDIIVEN